MKTSLEEMTSVKKKVIIELGSKEVDAKLDRAYKDLSKRAKVPGFRPGKIPKSILESRFSTQVEEDVTRDLINETFPKALQETSTIPLGTPLLEKEELKRGHDFTYSAVIEVRPEFEVKDYKGVEVEKELFNVSDEEVEKRLQQIQKANGKLRSIEEDRGVQKGDLAVIDYEAFEQGEPIEEMSSKNFLLEVGSSDFHPAFEDSLIGVKKDEEKEIEITFEDDYHHSLFAGKTVTFKVKMGDIKTVEIPELNDDFAEKLGAGIKNLQGLRDKIREVLESEEKNRVERELKQRLIKKISAPVEFELPQILVDSEIQYAIQNLMQNLMNRGSSLEKAGLTEEKLREDFRPQAETRCKEMLVLGKVAENEKLDLEDEDIETGFRDIALSTGQSPETVKKYYEARGLVDSLTESLLEQKTLNYLIENANVIEVEKITEEVQDPEKKGD